MHTTENPVFPITHTLAHLQLPWHCSSSVHIHYSAQQSEKSPVRTSLYKPLALFRHYFAHMYKLYSLRYDCSTRLDSFHTAQFSELCMHRQSIQGPCCHDGQVSVTYTTFLTGLKWQASLKQITWNNKPSDKHTYEWISIYLSKSPAHCYAARAQ